jgi:voltage-gated potassium channel
VQESTQTTSHHSDEHESSHTTRGVSHLLGVAGVDINERSVAVRWAQWLEWPILLVALWIPVQWYLEETGTVELVTARWFDWVIWLIFLFETTLLTSLVRNKKHYLVKNWMNLIIILAGVPFEWAYTPLIGALRNLRLVLMIFILFRMSHRIRNYLSRGHLGIMMLITGIVVVLAGIIMSRLDPSIGSIWDGMWYSWVTISHTGYGDIVPKTAAARFFGSIIIFLGIVLVTVFTASLSAFLIGDNKGKGQRGIRKEDRAIESHFQEVSERLDRIEKLLEKQNKEQSKI